MDDQLVEDPYLVKVTYEYQFEDGSAVNFAVDSDLTSTVQEEYSEEKHKWAELDFHKCDHCPLSSDEHKYCPASVSIADIIEYFNDHPDHTHARCIVHTQGKTIVAEKGIQEALAALIGLRLASSKCPILSHMKPMARFHDPFLSPYQLVYRATSMFLLGQYIRQLEGESPDWSVDGLKALYDKVGRVNMKLSERICSAGDVEATPCSMMIFSVLTISMTLLFDEHLEILKGLYESPAAE